MLSTDSRVALPEPLSVAVSGRRRRRSRVELGSLRDDDDALFAHEPALLVFLEVVTNLRARRDLDVFVDDGAADLRVPPDDDVLEEDRVLDVAERVHAHARREHAPVDAAARDDAAERHEALGRDADAR